MSYKIKLPEGMMKDLWRLREYAAEPSIIEQIRKAVGEYLKKKKTEIGIPIKEMTETIDRYERQKKNP